MAQNNGSSDDEQRNAIPLEVTFSSRTVVRVVVIVLLVLFAASVMRTAVYQLLTLLLLIVLAIFFAYLIAPLVNLIQKPFFERNRAKLMPRAVAIAIVYIGLLAVLWSAFTYLLPLVNDQVTQFAQQFPSYSEQVRGRLEELNRRYERTPIPSSVREQVQKSVQQFGDYIGETAPTIVGYVAVGLVSFLPYLVLIPILAFFLLKDAELFKLAAVKAFPRGRLRGRAELFFQDLNKTMAAYIRAQLVSCALIGTICTIGFTILGVPYSLLLGLIAAIFEFIPLAGPLTVLVLAATVASFTSFNQALYVVVFLLILRGLQDYVFYPRIIREGIHLHPLAIILAVLAGGELAGVTGIFLSIPLVAVGTVAYRHLLEHRGSAGIVAELLDKGKTEKAIDEAEKQLGAIHEKAEQTESRER